MVFMIKINIRLECSLKSILKSISYYKYLVELLKFMAGSTVILIINSSSSWWTSATSPIYMSSLNTSPNPEVKTLSPGITSASLSKR